MRFEQHVGINLYQNVSSVRLCQFGGHRVTKLRLVGCQRSVDILFVHGLLLSLLLNDKLFLNG